MNLPVDWQTVVVSLAALGAAFVVLRPFLPLGRSSTDAPACPKCAAGEAACAKPTTASASSPVMVLTPGSDRRH